MKFKDVITKAELNPKKLFLIDAYGAILSAFLFGVVLVKFEEIFGKLNSKKKMRNFSIGLIWF